MANASNPTKRERRRIKTERLRAAQRRRERRRTIGYTLGAVGVIALAVATVAISSGGGGDAEGQVIHPSASSAVSVSGPPRSGLLAIGERVPSFSAPGFRMERSGDGYIVSRQTVSWADYGGSPTVLSVWAEWCPHCQKELPLLASEVAKFPGVKLVTVLSSIDLHPGPTPEGYLSEHGLTFPVAVDDGNTTLARALGVLGFPTLYFVDSDGRVSFAADGEVPSDVLQQQLAKLS